MHLILSITQKTENELLYFYELKTKKFKKLTTSNPERFRKKVSVIVTFKF